MRTTVAAMVSVSVERAPGDHGGDWWIAGGSCGSRCEAAVVNCMFSDPIPFVEEAVTAGACLT